MSSVIVIFPKKDIALKIKNILVKNGMDVTAVCMTGAQALQAIDELDAGVVVSGARYPDMVFSELNEYLSEAFPMIVVATERQWIEYGEDGVDYIPIPFRAFELVDAVSHLLSDIDKRQEVQSQPHSSRTADEKQVILQAKERLMAAHGYTETEAHRFLQKRSMDNGTNLVDTAYMVLELY